MLGNLNAVFHVIFQTSDQESGEEDDGGGNEGKENGLFKNTNAQSVHQAEREKRERAKLDSQKKKEKDKEDRYKIYLTSVPSIFLFILQII